MSKKVTFVSNWEGKRVEATLLEKRRYTSRLLLEDGRVIIKKNRFLTEVTNADS